MEYLIFNDAPIYQHRINELAREGWRVVSVVWGRDGLTFTSVLMERPARNRDEINEQ